MRILWLAVAGLAGVLGTGCQTCSQQSSCGSPCGAVKTCSSPCGETKKCESHCEKAPKCGPVCVNNCCPTPNLMDQMKCWKPKFSISCSCGVSSCGSCGGCATPASTPAPTKAVAAPCPCDKGVKVVHVVEAPAPAAQTVIDVKALNLAPGEQLINVTEAVLPPVAAVQGDQLTLVGALVHNPRTNLWRLRFIGASEDDAFGGVVTLRGYERFLGTMKDGQTVAVKGGLVHAQTKSLNPDFAVADVKVVGQ